MKIGNRMYRPLHKILKLMNGDGPLFTNCNPFYHTAQLSLPAAINNALTPFTF